MKLRVIVLLNSLNVSDWEYQTILNVLQGGNASIVLAVVNKTPKTSGKKSPFLYRLYRWLDRKLFLIKPDAFALKNLENLDGWHTPVLPIYPIQKTYSDSFEKQDLQRIKAYHPDIILRLGFRILKGEILKIPKYGVWSFHHGDPTFYRGGPPAFWEVMNRKAITSAVLMRINEKLDQGEVIYQTFTQTDPLSVQRNANKIFWASSTFVGRVIDELHRVGEEQWKNKFLSPKCHSEAPLLKPPGTISMLKMVSDLLFRNFGRKTSEIFKKSHWQIAFVSSIPDQPTFDLSPDQTEIWEHLEPSRFYLADLFPLCFQGKEYLFAEEFDKTSKKGRIVYLEKDKKHIKVTPVLEENWHLSYPFIFENLGEVYMIPEAAESGCIFKYRAVEFPLKWQNVGVLFQGEAYDPTLVFKDGVYWLFVNQKAHEACSPFDELNLYWTDDLNNPKWIPHIQNPIVSDVRKSRPAGNIIEENGNWYRPAQDSGLRYGYQVHLQEITVWTQEEYVERTVQTISPTEALGIHTFNKSRNGYWIDFFSKR